MARNVVAGGLILLSVAGAWWFAQSCLADDCSVPLGIGTGGIFVGALLAAMGMLGATSTRSSLLSTGLAAAGLSSLVFVVAEVRGPVVLPGFALFIGGLGLAAVGAGALGRTDRRFVAALGRVRLGLALAGIGCLTWAVEKVLTPDLALPPYLLAPLGLLVAAYALPAGVPAPAASAAPAGPRTD